MSWAKPIKWVNHCGKVVTQLLDPHFERKHKLTHAAAKACFRLIKEEESGKKMLKCSLCNKVYKNLSHHLLNSHILKRPSAESHRYRTEAKRTVEDTLDFYSEGSQNTKQVTKNIGEEQVNERSQLLNRFVKWCKNPIHCAIHEDAAAHCVRLLKLWGKMRSCKNTFADITRANLESAVCEMMKYPKSSTLRTYPPQFLVAAEVPQNGGIL